MVPHASIRKLQPRPCHAGGGEPQGVQNSGEPESQPAAWAHQVRRLQAVRRGCWSVAAVWMQLELHACARLLSPASNLWCPPGLQPRGKACVDMCVHAAIVHGSGAAAQPAAYLLLKLWAVGVCRALANNMVLGTSAGWTKTLSLVGVGYRASVAGTKLTLNLGYSHPIEMEVPKGLDVKVGQHCALQMPLASVFSQSGLHHA